MKTQRTPTGYGRPFQVAVATAMVRRHNCHYETRSHDRVEGIPTLVQNCSGSLGASEIRSDAESLKP